MTPKPFDGAVYMDTQTASEAKRATRDDGRSSWPLASPLRPIAIAIAPDMHSQVQRLATVLQRAGAFPDEPLTVRDAAALWLTWLSISDARGTPASAMFDLAPAYLAAFGDTDPDALAIGPIGTMTQILEAAIAGRPDAFREIQLRPGASIRFIPHKGETIAYGDPNAKGGPLVSSDMTTPRRIARAFMEATDGAAAG